MFSHRTLEDGVHIGINNHGCTLAEFVEMFPGYTLDPKYKFREYLPNEFHRLKSAAGTESGPLPWPEGDKYIAAAEDIAAVLAIKVHGENWKKVLESNTAEGAYKVKLQAKFQLAKAAAERLKAL